MSYNTFEMSNINKTLPDERISKIFRAISTPVRLQILAAIGHGETCVCHLEALLDLRQAYISQQLMELRDADLLETRREGRYIFYRLAEPKILELIIEMGSILGIPTSELEELINSDPLPHCCCPNCAAQITPTFISEQNTLSKE